LGGFGVSLVARGTDADELEAVAQEVAAIVTALGSTPDGTT
jgi:hypothetical protein